MRRSERVSKFGRTRRCRNQSNGVPLFIPVGSAAGSLIDALLHKCLQKLLELCGWPSENPS